MPFSELNPLFVSKKNSSTAVQGCIAKTMGNFANVSLQSLPMLVTGQSSLVRFQTLGVHLQIITILLILRATCCVGMNVSRVIFCRSSFQVKVVASRRRRPVDIKLGR